MSVLINNGYEGTPTEALYLFKRLEKQQLPLK